MAIDQERPKSVRKTLGRHTSGDAGQLDRPVGKVRPVVINILMEWRINDSGAFYCPIGRIEKKPYQTYSSGKVSSVYNLRFIIFGLQYR